MYEHTSFTLCLHCKFISRLDNKLCSNRKYQFLFLISKYYFVGKNLSMVMISYVFRISSYFCYLSFVIICLSVYLDYELSTAISNWCFNLRRQPANHIRDIEYTTNARSHDLLDNFLSLIYQHNGLVVIIQVAYIYLYSSVYHY